MKERTEVGFRVQGFRVARVQGVGCRVYSVQCTVYSVRFRA